ncbi:PsbP-related protein [Natronorubrum sp. DTA7]|uniref:PsbP-related protein n=1 Tax=Natronorubrum sp. DTA7 TaxID=3447016 RepID=UPI003F85AAF4
MAVGTAGLAGCSALGISIGDDETDTGTENSSEDNATTAEEADNATTAEEADNATTAEEADNATTAEEADNATTAEEEDVSLSTYTSSSYPYSVLYPDSWAVDNTDPQLVVFSEGQSGGTMAVNVEEKYHEEETVGQATERKNQDWKREFPDYEVLNHERISLPNNYVGMVMDTTYTNGGDLVRDKTLITIDQYLYVVEVNRYEADYTDQFDAVAAEIAESFTITDDDTF